MKEKIRSSLTTVARAREWLGDRFAPSKEPLFARSRLARTAIACASIFFVALGVRLFEWQDLRVDFDRGESLASKLIKPYQKEVSRMAADGGVLFPRAAVDAGDARMILHPPGYAILIRMLSGEDSSDESHTALRLTQVLADSAASVVLFLIAAELLSFSVALVGALMVAVSPHLAYHSLWLSPETIAALPILIAVYLIVKAHKRPRLITVILAGAMIGLSCWLRSNALLLAPLLGVALSFLIERGRRLRYSAALVTATIIVIAPIIIRNWVVYGRFIPLSIGSGITLIEGISDYDKDKRFGLPASDTEMVIKDAEWHGRPDYADNLWMPDGIERDRSRFARGAEVIGRNPVWFAGVMLRRAAFMVRYNDGDPADWPVYTCKVPVVAAEPPIGQPLSIPDETQPVWSRSGEELIADGGTALSQAEVSAAGEGRPIEIKSDRAEFQDQFASAPVAIKEGSDYVVRLSAHVTRGVAAAKVTSDDRRITLASSMLPLVNSEREAGFTLLPFASGDRTTARLVISNDLLKQDRSIVQVDRAELFELGPTPQRWTAAPRAAARGLQKNLFKTGLMRVLIVLGIALLVATKRRVALLCLLAVPLYYMGLQSTLHTEYRYILVIHYFLFVMAAVALCALFLTAIEAVRRVTISKIKSQI